jgi:hypothetical protein
LGTLSAVFTLMLYFIVAQLFSLLLDCLVNRTRSDRQKDLEIRLLRQQLLILQRHQAPSSRLSRGEKIGRAVLASKFVNLGCGGKIKFAEVLRLFKPDTLLGWHRALGSIAHTKDNYPVALYRRQARGLGAKRAVIAVAHSVLVISYYTLRDGSEYKDLGANYFSEVDKVRLERHHVHRLEQLGYAVTLTSAEAARSTPSFSEDGTG